MKEAIRAQMAVFDQEIKEHQRGRMTFRQRLMRSDFLRSWRAYEEADSDDEEPEVHESEDGETQLTVQAARPTLSDFDFDDPSDDPLEGL